MGVGERACLLLIQRDGPQAIDCLAAKLATSARQVRRWLASLERQGYAHRSRGVAELTPTAAVDCVFRTNTFSTTAQLNSYRTDAHVRRPDNQGGGKGGVFQVPESSVVEEKTTGARSSEEKKSKPHAERDAAAAEDRAARLARWLVRQIEGLGWSPAYRIATAVERGEWSTAELRRVLGVTLARRSRGELAGPAWQYFVTSCKNEIDRCGYRWARA